MAAPMPSGVPVQPRLIPKSALPANREPHRTMFAGQPIIPVRPPRQPATHRIAIRPAITRRVRLPARPTTCRAPQGLPPIRKEAARSPERLTAVLPLHPIHTVPPQLITEVQETVPIPRPAGLHLPLLPEQGAPIPHPLPHLPEVPPHRTLLQGAVHPREAEASRLAAAAAVVALHAALHPAAAGGNPTGVKKSIV